MIDMLAARVISLHFYTIFAVILAAAKNINITLAKPNILTPGTRVRSSRNVYINNYLHSVSNFITAYGNDLKISFEYQIGVCLETFGISSGRRLRQADIYVLR